MSKEDTNKKKTSEESKEFAEKEVEKKESKEFLEGDAAPKEQEKKKNKPDGNEDNNKKNIKKKSKKKLGKKAKIAIVIAVVIALVAAGVGIYFWNNRDHKVPGTENGDELEVAPDSLSIIEEGEYIRQEDVTAITGVTNASGEVVDSEGILDLDGHRIYDTGHIHSATGLKIYTTGKMDSDGNILYTLNQADSFGKLLYYTGKYVDGKLVLTATVERPDYTSNAKPNPYTPETTTKTVTVPVDSSSNATITGMSRDYIKYFGGKAADNYKAIAPCSDGGYVVAAYSNSFDGDYSGISKDWAGHGTVVKYDASGNVSWRYDVGGDSEVWINDVTELKDGTIIAVGFTMSEEAEPSKLSKGQSAIVIRLKADGEYMWTYVFPGSMDENGEWIECVDATPDGGFVVGGKAVSDDGFFKSDETSIKAFIFKFDKNCNIEWRQTLQGTKSNNFTSIDVNSNGDIYATCVTYSWDGSFAGIQYKPTKTGENNTVLVKLNKNGELQWKKYLQGSGISEYNAVYATDDGGCVVAGRYTVSKKADGIYTSTYGNSDGMLIRYNKNGDLNWKRVIGGSADDYIHGVTQVDGGFVIVGRTDSPDGDFSGETLGGGEDGFIMYLNEQGEIHSNAKLVFEGKYDDYAAAVCTLSDGRVAVVGSTKSKDGFYHNSEVDKQFEGYVAVFTTKY